MKNSNTVLIIVIVIVLAVGGYFIFHKSPKSTPSTSTQNVAAVNNAVLKTKTTSGIGQYLASPNGKALYTYQLDSKNTSNCSGSCLAQWPAYVDTGSTSNLPSGVGVIKRSDDNQEQYTYKGMPLYFFISDSSGKVTGNGIGSFSVAKP
ncbi:MAG TPA: hypothetical protein VGS28_02455 [Candidatus Saccharimonadales bacterium]|nr:hypothetical protein [Candidatus Saccharimonadales bacterium]